MGKNSAIQWTDATWNVARGCSKVDEDCKFCYMYRDSMDGHRYDPLEVVKTKGVFTFPLKYKATTSEAWGGRPLIFTSSLTDWGHEAIDSYRHEIWQQVKQCPHLIFQMLTKRIGRGNAILPEDWGNDYENVWLGTSIGSEEAIYRAYTESGELKYISTMAESEEAARLELADEFTRRNAKNIKLIKYGFIGGGNIKSIHVLK